MKRVLYTTLSCLFFLLLFGNKIQAQVLRGLQSRTSSASSSMSNSGKRDSLIVPKKREKLNINIHYKTLDDVLYQDLDTSITDFTDYLPLPADHVYLGNLGTPAYSMIYQPRKNIGFDAGFHALDVYRFNVDSTRYYNTTTPYTRLRYLIGPSKEQLIDVLLTENFSPDLNVGFRFRKINEPGVFQNQTTDDNSINIFVHYNTKNKRYHAYLSFVSNKLHAGENGGIMADSMLKEDVYNNRKTIPVQLGGSNTGNVGFFSTSIPTQSGITESSWLFRQHYDWGLADTIPLTDTSFEYQYHPNFRIEHTLKATHINALFKDKTATQAVPYYMNHYGVDSLGFLGINKLRAVHDWRTFSNDLSVIKFPDKMNQAHFLKLGITYENIKGEFLKNSIKFNNLKGHAEYHNYTKNGKWELNAKGEFVIAGRAFGDYMAYGSLERYLNKKFGRIQLSFMNLNQTPSFSYRFFQSNSFLSTNTDLNKTNITRIQFKADNSHLKYDLKVNYFLLSNYTYFKNFYTSEQEQTAFNLLQIILNKKFKFGHLAWYLNLALQQTTGNNPLELPLAWTRNRLGYEGVLFTNLHLFAGLEFKYHTAYYAPDYSPVLQQFIYQNAAKIQNDLPNVDAFIHFRIKSFIAYVRAENLNELISPNTIEIPHYPYPGFGVRVGLEWSLWK